MFNEAHPTSELDAPQKGAGTAGSEFCLSCGHSIVRHHAFRCMDCDCGEWEGRDPIMDLQPVGRQPSGGAGSGKCQNPGTGGDAEAVGEGLRE